MSGKTTTKNRKYTLETSSDIVLDDFILKLTRKATMYIRNSFSKMQNFEIEQIILDESPNRRASRGGLYSVKGNKIPGISLAMVGTRRMLRNGEQFNNFEFPCNILEYKSFGHGEYGSFYSYDPVDYIRMDVLHEVSHAAQFFAKNFNLYDYDRVHGKSFLKFYIPLRQTYLNKGLPDQQKAKEHYEEYVDTSVFPHRIKKRK